jgi:hypothetical protein
MKKSILVLLMALGLVLAGQSAYAALDDDMALLAAVFDDDLYLPATCDLDANGMLDSDELALMEAVIAGGNTNVAAAYAANQALFHQVFDPAAILYGAPNIDALCRLLGGLATLGDPAKVAWLVNEIETGFNEVFAAAAPLVEANMVTTAQPVVGAGGDVDGDTLTNQAEYDAIDGIGGPGSALRTTFLTDAQTYDFVTTDLIVTISISPRTTLFEGSGATLTAVVGNGTAPTIVKWFRGSTEVGTGLTHNLTGALSDAGSYTAVVTDSSDPIASDTSNAITVSVLAAADLPVMGIAGLVLLAGLAGAIGVRKLRK